MGDLRPSGFTVSAPSPYKIKNQSRPGFRGFWAMASAFSARRLSLKHFPLGQASFGVERRGLRSL